MGHTTNRLGGEHVKLMLSEIKDAQNQGSAPMKAYSSTCVYGNRRV